MPRASVASCLNTIGRKIVSFEMFPRAGLLETPATVCKDCAVAKPFRKTCSQAILDHRLLALIAIAGRFGEIQPGFLQLLLTTQTLVK